MSEEVNETLTYEVKPGIFKNMVNRASDDPDHNYALLIDEINRGNVASIFGELIALIEEDKRKGAPNELRAQLPYSRQEFVVPRNLYIIGAMNTADRSVEALDMALRRRFTFVAIPPQPELIQQPGNLEVDIRRLLITINARIEKLLDKDHCIGHSYFMGIEKKDIRPDIIAQIDTGSNCERVVMDTKWKIPGDGKPGDADLQQMHAYNVHSVQTEASFFIRESATKRIFRGDISRAKRFLRLLTITVAWYF